MGQKRDTIFRKMNMRISLFVFGLLFLSAIPGKAIAAWDKQSETAFLALMCSTDSYFLKCFELTSEKCRTDLKKSVNQCQGSVGITKLAKKSSGAAGTSARAVERPLTEKEEIELHSKIGLCAGLKVEKLWSDRKASSTECRKRENWQ